MKEGKQRQGKTAELSARGCLKILGKRRDMEGRKPSRRCGEILLQNF